MIDTREHTERSQAIRGSTSAPTARVLDVVELLARPGSEQLRFSDVVRELDLTQATAHTILKTLSDRGWVSRDPVAKTFSLGPALAVVAARTDLARPLAHAARAAALQLSADVGYAASVVERVGADALVITAFEGTASVHPAGIPGDRIPYAPPFGVAFAAWDTADAQRAWIARGGAVSAALTTRLEEVLTRTRERGYDVDATTPALAQAAQMVGQLDNDGLPEHVRAIMDQLLLECTTLGLSIEDDEHQGTQQVASIAAPVFDQRGQVALIVSAHPLCALPARDIDAIGQRLVAATSALQH